ncbi:MAG: glycosyltransferase family 2 protein [Oscillospiraceae bacterium]|jgi:glycosyltransferase involved in cell wall biosynthesis|nr:glycosyltransferase family 2 protein [Oscillospiraceae bacterium]
MNILYIIIPCYNEESALELTMGVLLEKLHSLVGAGRVSPDSRVLLIDDGSSDRTWEIIENLAATDAVCGLKLSRNRGTQNALSCGYDYARRYADIAVSTDADLQDDPNAIDLMLREFENGADIVYGVRNRRDVDSLGKRASAVLFYKFMRALGSESAYNHSDYRLLSRRAMDALAEYTERDMFIRDVTPLLGFKSAVVQYERGARNAGTSKYNFAKLAKLALDGMCSASLRPVRLIAIGGIAMIAVAVLTVIVSFFIGLAAREPISGSTLVIATIWFVGGIITAGVGVVGEYAGRAFMEAKRRPRFHIETEIGLPEKKRYED